MPFDGLETPLSHLAKFDQVVDLIDAPGQWTKHSYRTPRGQYCLKEAMNNVGVADIFEPIILKVAEEVMEREFCCVESFNDHPQTAHSDVVGVLHRVREGIAAGRFKLAAPASARPTVRWNEYRAPSAGSRSSNLWRKLFAWG